MIGIGPRSRCDHARTLTNQSPSLVKVRMPQGQASIAVNRVTSTITRLMAAVLSNIYRLPIDDWLIQPVLGGGDASFVSNRFIRM